MFFKMGPIYYIICHYRKSSGYSFIPSFLAIFSKVPSSDIRKYNEFFTLNPNNRGRDGITDAKRYNVEVDIKFKNNKNVIEEQGKLIYKQFIGEITADQAKNSINEYVKLASNKTKASKINNNNAPSNVSARFQFERVKEASTGEWSYGTPIWDIKYTEDGYHYHNVGCVTAFPGDGVQATIWNNDTVKGTDPFEVFEAAVSAAKDFDLEAWFYRNEEETV